MKKDGCPVGTKKDKKTGKCVPFKDWLDEWWGYPLLESQCPEDFIKKNDKCIHKHEWVKSTALTAWGPQEMHEIAYITLPNEEGEINSTRIFITKREDLNPSYPYRVNIDFDSRQKSIIKTFPSLKHAKHFVNNWKKLHPEG